MILLKNVLVATDFGEAADAALTYGRALARTFGADLHVLHVMDNVFLRAIASDPAALRATARTRLHDRLIETDRDLHARTVLEVSDDPASEIVDYAASANIDLIVMGTHGRRGAAHVLMGSVAEHVVRAAPCPVLTVRHPEREFVIAEHEQVATQA